MKKSFYSRASVRRLCSLLGNVGVLALIGLAHDVAAEAVDCSKAAALVRESAQNTDTSHEAGATRSLEKRERLEKAVALCPTMPEAHYNLAITYLQQHEAEKAEKDFRAALNLNEQVVYRIGLGQALIDLKRAAEAVEILEQAQQKDPKNVAVLQTLTVAYEASGDIPRARRVAEKVRELDPASTAALFNFALLSEKAGDNETALAAYRDLLAIEPEHRDGLLRYAILLGGAGQWSESAKILERAAALPQSNDAVQRALALAHEKSGELDRAEIALRRALERAPDNAETLLRLGAILMAEKREAQAEEFLLRAIAIDPKNPEAFVALGRAQTQLGKFSEAETSLQRALGIDALSAVAHNNYGIMLVRAGRPEEARKEFESALRLQPGMAEAQSNIEHLP